MRIISGLLCLALLSAFTQPAFARIGEPLDQLTARYGPGTNAGKDVLVFHKQNWTITVCLMDGISVQENYQKTGGATDEDIASLLSLNSQGHEWKEKPVPRTIVSFLMPAFQAVLKAWIRDDGAYAFVPGGGVAHGLTIESKQKIDADNAKDAAAKKAQQSSLQGF